MTISEALRDIAENPQKHGAKFDNAEIVSTLLNAAEEIKYHKNQADIFYQEFKIMESRFNQYIEDKQHQESVFVDVIEKLYATKEFGEK